MTNEPLTPAALVDLRADALREDSGFIELTTRDVLALLDEVDRLHRWKDEALPVIGGLQELGRALGVGLGKQITGPGGVKAAKALVADRDTALVKVQRARRWIETCVDPVAVGVETKRMMLDYLDGLRDLPDDITTAAPTAIPARLLSGEHVGREVVLPDGRNKGTLVSAQVEVVLSRPRGGFSSRRLAPDDVVTLVAQPGADQ